MSAIETIMTGCPVVGCETLSLGRYHDPSGLGREQLTFFDHEIIWVRESESSIRFIHGGEEVREGSTWNDFYGFLASMTDDGALEEAQRLARKFKVGPRSTLSIIVSTRIQDIPVLRDTSPEGLRACRRGDGWKKRFIHAPRDWFLKDEAAEMMARPDRPRDAWQNLTRLRPRLVAEEPEIWSSAIGEAENEARAKAFRTTHQAEAARLSAKTGNIFR